MKLMLSLLTVIFAASPAMAAPKSKGPEALSVKNSNLSWNATKKIGSGHSGTIALKRGQLQVENGMIKAGEFDIDMTKLAVTDIPASSKDNAKLVGHLRSDDFFSVEKNPTAAFVVTKVTKGEGNTQMVTGNLTIKGVTQAVTFPAEVTKEGQGWKATAKITIDRTTFGVRYGSAKHFANLMADRIINDNFDVNVELRAEK
jgi:polyisoprenoid-binding protein YceI